MARIFHSEYLARKAKHPGESARAATGHGAKPARRSVADLFGAGTREAESRRRAREAVSLSREHGWSLSKSARAAHTTRDNVRRWAPSAIDERGRVKRSDTETRLMPVVSAGQVFPAVAIRGSRQAGLVSAHLRAIRTYLSTGDARAMHSFRGKSVTGTLPNGEHRVFELEADLDYIDALAASAAFDGLTVGS